MSRSKARPSPSTLRTPWARWPHDMTTSLTPWDFSQSSMKTMKGRSTRGTTGLGTVEVSGRSRVPSPPARMSACTSDRPVDRGAADRLIGQPGGAGGLGVEEVAAVDEQGSAHRGRHAGEGERLELGPLRDEHDGVGAGDRLL